jgi:hypothetical protein
MTEQKTGVEQRQSAKITEVANLLSPDESAAVRILKKTMIKLALAGVPAAPASHLCARNVEEFCHLQHLRSRKLKQIKDSIEGVLPATKS